MKKETLVLYLKADDPKIKKQFFSTVIFVGSRIYFISIIMFIRFPNSDDRLDQIDRSYIDRQVRLIFISTPQVSHGVFVHASEKDALGRNELIE